MPPLESCIFCDNSFESTHFRNTKPDRLTPVHPHAPAWGATAPRLPYQGSDAVSIHAPAWGATSKISIHAPHGGDDQSHLVSIHAPAWGATRHRLVMHDRIDVSIHAPAWGATRRLVEPADLIDAGFNPRPRMGGDMDAGHGIDAIEFQSTPPHGGRRHKWIRVPSSHVSIHAPAWGATRSGVNAIGVCSFNPRPRMGGDPCRSSAWSLQSFQSTPPHGGRP